MNKLDGTTVKHSKLRALIYSLFIIAATLMLSYYVYSSQNKVLQQILEGQGDRTKIKIVNNVNDLLGDLQGMSKRWLNDPGMVENIWRADANDFIQRVKGVYSLWMIDEENKCKWIVSDSNSSKSRCNDLMASTENIDQLTHALINKSINFTRVYQVEGHNTLYIFQPLIEDVKFSGYIAIEVRVESFVNYILGDPVNSGYYTKAYAGQETVFANGPELTNHSYLHVFKLDMDSDHESWIFKVYPSEVTLGLIITHLPYFIIIVGVIIAVLFMLTLWSKQKAKDESNKLAEEIKQKEKIQFELEYLANHDTLTHLPNRYYITNYIESRVKLAKQGKQKFTLFFIDLDHFKDINDTLGHAIGDRMLKRLPILFNQVFRHDDVIARMGGDEFVVFLPGEMNDEQVSNLLQRFLKSLENPIQIEEHLIRLTGSVGVAFYPQHGSNVTELLSHADAALYRAKDKGRNTFAIYDSVIEQIAKDRVQLIARLHTANENDEFEMYFQPRYRLTDNKLIGAEALIRWRTAYDGIIEPVGFLNILEDTSLIVPVSYQKLTESCEQFKKIHELQADLFLSFNVSAKLLEHKDFLSTIKSILAKTNYPPERLELELTEQVLIQNVENSQYILGELKQMGVSIAIDDFGTGYSSLSYLKNFPVNVLKIDKSFILDIDSDADDLELVKTMITMGKNLNITTVAEGVENETQLQLLTEELCDQVQGFYFNRPMRYYDFYQLVDD